MSSQAAYFQGLEAYFFNPNLTGCIQLTAWAIFLYTEAHRANLPVTPALGRT